MIALFSKLTQSYMGSFESIEQAAQMILDAPGYYGAIDGYEALHVGDTHKELDYIPLFRARAVNKTVAWPDNS